MPFIIEKNSIYWNSKNLAFRLIEMADVKVHFLKILIFTWIHYTYQFAFSAFFHTGFSFVLKYSGNHIYNKSQTGNHVYL